jgi:hypothetical protein
MPNIPRPSRQRVPKHQPPEPQRELSLERSRDIERRIGRDRLPPRYLGLQIRPEEMKLLTELGRFRVITARDLTETVYENQKGRFTHDLQFLKDENLVATDYVNARRDGRLQKVEHIEVVTHQDGTGLGPRQW